MKIVTRMLGGMGNQLFILSYALKLALEHGLEDSEIVLDLREYKNYSIRNFELENVIDGHYIRSYTEDDGCVSYDLTRKLYHLVQYFFRSEGWKDKLLFPLSKLGLYYTGVNVSKYNKDINLNCIYLYGYFQSSQVAFDVKKLLIGILGLSKNEKCSDDTKHYIAVSVRCGKDYVDGGWKVYDSQYYQKGLCEIIKRKKYGDACVLIFSDDIDVAKKMSICDHAIYIENKTPYEQLQLMYNCDDYVISNSSFSWWGAVLGMSDYSIVIAPDIWYEPNIPTEKTQLHFEQMIIVNSKE